MKYSLIVGASKGIGRAIAITLAKEGYTNILVARNKDGLEETKKQCDEFMNSHVISFDINEDQRKLVEEIGKITQEINFLWLGGGDFGESKFEETPEDELLKIINTTYVSLVNLTSHVYKLLKDGKANIVSASSDWSDFNTGGPAVFGSAKVALAAFLDKLRKEALLDNIKVTNLKMGNVGSLEGYELNDSEKQIIETNNSMVTLKDICDAIKFIISRETGLITELTIIPSDPNYS
jgi:3-oxoacyl-[acyl-carrier protein] reductase